MALAKIKLSMKDEQTPPKIEIEGNHRHLMYLLGVFVNCIAEESRTDILDVVRDIGVASAVMKHGMEED